MKGQKSLEMIIGLVMLLVVASVTISMFLNVFQEPDLGERTQEKQAILNECSEKCNSYKGAGGEKSTLSAALEYCTAKFSRDVNQDGSTNDIAGAGYNSYCEDGIHCFNVHSCETGINEELSAERCRELMCEYYTKINKDPIDETEEDNVHDHIQDVMSPQNEENGVGSCGLAEAEDSAGYQIATWYNPRESDYSFTGGENGLSCATGGSTSSSAGEASQWCQDNGNGEAVADGCKTQTEALSITAENGGQLYYSEDNEGINCPEGQVYICEN